MPRPFSLTISGIVLEPILDPLGCSDVSIGQSPSNWLGATPKLSVGMPFRDQEGAHVRGELLLYGTLSISNFQNVLTAHSYLICDNHLELFKLPWVCIQLLSPVPNSLNRPNLSPLSYATFSLGLLGHIP